MSSKFGLVRITGGNFKKKRIVFPSVPQLRPATSFERERLFSWLYPDVKNSRCLDLFSGSGILGFESISRGAAWVSFLEKSPTACLHLKKNIESLSATEMTSIHCKQLKKTNMAYILQALTEPKPNIIFVDPPFSETQCMLDIVTVLQSLELSGVKCYFKMYVAPLPPSLNLIKDRIVKGVRFAVCLL